MTYTIDYVAPQHQDLHRRLINWARYVTPSRAPSLRNAIYRKAKSNWRQWHEVEYKAPVDELDGDLIERIIAGMPIPEREALRWYYVRTHEHTKKVRHKLKVGEAGLAAVLQYARIYLAIKLQTKSFLLRAA